VTGKEIRHAVLELMMALLPRAHSWLPAQRQRLPGATPALPPSTRPQVLLVDHDFPEIDRDAGSRAIASFATILDEAGFQVVYWAASQNASTKGRATVEALGLVAFDRRQTGALSTWLSKVGQSFVACVLSRPLVAAMFTATVKKHVHGACIYYGHDIHHQRIRAMQHMTGMSWQARWQCWIQRRMECRLWLEVDTVVYPSKAEAAVVNLFRQAHQASANAVMFPLWTIDSSGRRTHIPLDERDGLLFVGSHDHPPNIDGLNWFIEFVSPHLDTHGGKLVLTIVGSGMEQYVPPATDTLNIRVRGRVTDVELDQAYNQARVVIAPLRFGAGVKGKVVEAIDKGVPCILTSVAAQGLEEVAHHLPVEDEAEAFAKAVCELLADSRAWQLAAEGACAALSAYYDPAVHRTRARRIILQES